MKKKILIPITVFVLLAVLFVPVPKSAYKDGGTTEYCALTYKIVKWNRLTSEETFRKTKVYFFPDNFKSIDNLWEEEKTSLESTFQGVVREVYDTTVIVEPFAEEGEWRSSDKISFGITKLEKINAQVGDVVQVTYTGEIMCTYPAQIFAKSWKLISKEHNCQEDESVLYVAKKPVIYLYPKKKTDVTVSLSLKGKLTCAYPKYGDMWRVTAMPDGTLYDKQGKQYNYLYWEGETNAEYDFSKGFCVKGEDTAAFLETALSRLGLNRREANEFIIYWLPLMQENKYNVISFQNEAYVNTAQLNITPAPDTLIRVFMAYKPVKEFVKIEEQTLFSPKRIGFTAVEWGGAEAK